MCESKRELTFELLTENVRDANYTYGPQERKHFVCDAWLQEGRIISHDPITEDGFTFCGQCGLELYI